MTEKTSAENFVDTIRDDPQAIIEWAKREIKEYEELIEILEKRL